jgi:RNA polymerase sigma-70 factor (ECF subfamily)
MDDKQILSLFEARSEQAIRELAAKYGPLCKNLAYHILVDSHDAEECVNDAYLALWEQIPPAQPGSLSAYLCAIVRNIAITRYHANTAKKRNSSYTVSLQELERDIPCPNGVDDELEARRITDSINTFLKKLDKHSRVLFIRRYWHGYSIEELSQLFGISHHTVSVRLSRIREKLKKHLRKDGVQI